MHGSYGHSRASGLESTCWYEEIPTRELEKNVGCVKAKYIGIASTVETMDLNIGKPLVRTKLIIPLLEIASGAPPHTVLKVRRLRPEEDWVIDPAGCQYGFRAVLVPFRQYLADHECRVASPPNHYRWTETKDLDYYRTLPFAAVEPQDDTLEREARLHYAEFVDKHFGENNSTLRALLDGPAAQFQCELDGVAGKLRDHMKEFAEKRLPKRPKF